MHEGDMSDFWKGFWIYVGANLLLSMILTKVIDAVPEYTPMLISSGIGMGMVLGFVLGHMATVESYERRGLDELS